MHNYEHYSSTNIISIINYFENYGYRSDGNDDELAYPSSVNFMTKVFSNSSEATEAAEENSYYGGTCISIATVAAGKTTKTFKDAYNSFIAKRKDYLSFKNNLTIAYGRKANKVTCPNCGSSISLQHGKYFKCCPVCQSKKIISDSNWKTLETKKAIMIKGSEILNREANKSAVTFVGAIGWHS